MKIFENVRAVIFDMDGTILDSMWAWRGENRHFLKRHGYPIPKDLEDKIDTVSSHLMAKRMSEEFDIQLSYDDIFNEYVESLKVHYATDVFPKKGVRAFLEKLREEGIKVCVATATPRDVAMKALEKHDLLKHFLFVTDDSEMGVTKSSPEYYKKVCERLGEDTSCCVMFEDAYYAMKASTDAGLTAFAIFDNVHAGNQELVKKIKAIANIYVNDFDEAAGLLF